MVNHAKVALRWRDDQAVLAAAAAFVRETPFEIESQDPQAKFRRVPPSPAPRPSRKSLKCVR